MTQEFRADLHCHSTCSDGSLTPVEIVHLAKEIGLSALSITDHDTIEAYKTATAAAQEAGIELITGIEFSSSQDGESVHILGYGFDTDNEAINTLCAKHKERRSKRNGMILDLLKKHNMPLTEDDLPKATKKTVGRPHIAQAMVEKGYVATIQDAFRKYIGEGCPCYTTGPVFTVAETIDVLHKANAVAIIAHPHIINDNRLINELLELPFDGIECYYARYPATSHDRWLKIATKHHWLITGGSDFHGAVKPNLPLGSSWIDQEHFTNLKNALQPR